MARRLAAAAAAGVAFGVAGTRMAQQRKVPSLTGTWRLNQNDASNSRALLVYEPDGRMWQITTSDGKPTIVTAMVGRWCVHNASTSYAATYPPHDGTMVEHELLAASDAEHAGTTTVQRYSLSPVGDVLGLSDVELRNGRSEIVSTSEWRRVES